MEHRSMPIAARVVVHSINQYFRRTLTPHLVVAVVAATAVATD